MLRLFLLLLFASQAWACSVSKQQLWTCLIGHADKNANTALEEAEIRHLVHDNTFWYERLLKSPDSVVQQLKQHCGVPLNYANFLKSSCFRHCGGIDGKRTIYNRICR